MPGYLIPSDLDRMKPAGQDVFAWAEQNLLASPGALVSRNGIAFRINTLVPAKKRDGSCINLRDGLCQIHAIAPFGCAFFSCRDGLESYGLSAKGLHAIMRDKEALGLYRQIWLHLDSKGLRSQAPEVLRKRMNNQL
jgi:hypothetical protein